MNKLINDDCLVALKQIPDNSADCIVTDPPYGYSFMGKGWDKVVVSVDIWAECLRVLKPGAFAFIMSAPRQDVLSHMIVNLEQAGFVTGFTSMYHCYASGFPKASNIGKMVDKKLGNKREVTGTGKAGSGMNKIKGFGVNTTKGGEATTEWDETKGNSSLEGSYGGFQPKPAVEIILVVMKPITEKTYVDQAMNNKKGITWLDDGRIPYESDKDKNFNMKVRHNSKDNVCYSGGSIGQGDAQGKDTGRFPANLLVSDDCLNDGKEWAGGKNNTQAMSIFGNDMKNRKQAKRDSDSGSFSRYFSLDAWFNDKIKQLSPEVQKTFPFLIVPKAAKSEKNEGLKISNKHPTVKSVKLMSYLIAIGSRPGDVILDPFAGSGTAGVSATAQGREYILIEREKEYFEILKARTAESEKQGRLF